MKRLTKKQLSNFDTPETLLVVSLYPKKGETYSSGTTGVASYTKNLVTHMNRPVVVLADQNKKTSIYKEKNTLVVRCFQKGKRGMWRSVWSQLRQFKQAKTILVQFDFSMYGSFLTSGLIIPFFALLKIFGYNIHIVSHHVVTDVNKLKGHVGLKNTWKDKIKARLYNLIFKLFYLTLNQVTDSIIVLEETLRRRLANLVGKSNVENVPHAVDIDLPIVTKQAARKKLGIPQKDAVVLFFGFANWFKGADIFAEKFKGISQLTGKKAHFIIAGGASPTMNSKSFYQKYLAGLHKTIEHSKSVTMTGYVEQDDIKHYFAAADVVVFPYRYFMCASGVLSLVFSYKKPFIVSDRLEEMFTSEDFESALRQAHLEAKDLQFSLEDNSAIALTKKVLNNGRAAKMKKMGSIIRQKRSFQNNAALYESVLFAPTKTEQKQVSYAFTYQK